MKANEKYSKAVEFVKKYGYGDSKKYINNAHNKATHIYIGYMGTASYFYQHPNLNWCEVDRRTTGRDSDRCCYDVHPPISSMFVIDELKRLVESYELVMEFGDDTSYLKEHLLRNPTIKEFYLDDWCRTFSVVRLKQAIADVESCM